MNASHLHFLSSFPVKKFSIFPLCGCLIALASTAFAELDATAAAARVGETITMVDRIHEVIVKPSGTIFLNFGKAYPNEVLTAVIMAETLPRFPGAADWAGRRVQITGEVSDYKNHRRIILRERNQIHVIGDK